ncbi:MAG: hypothetical protein CMF14_06445 [Idiomarina sp.]|nr:hypothetical protein [Idiomarina sp.]MBE92532.1 hypothetical protein [Idiomarina sp.]MBH93817.1 hypothetical protein [Idiomarina sp.]|tara:strand:+ start:631 stop:861 length:231 start_codon:yes stop_codon:yes gene_type:complete
MNFMIRFIKFIILVFIVFVVLVTLFHSVSYILYFLGITSEFLGLEDFKRNYYIVIAASVGFALGESVFKSRKKSRD